MRAVAIKEVGAHAGFVLTEVPETMPGMDARLPKTGADCLVDDGLQAAAMDRELRHLVARVGSAQIAPDLLPEPVGVEQLVGSDPHRIEAIEQSKLRQFFDGVRQRVDADPELSDGIRLLVNVAVDPAGMQHEGGREPTDAAADHDNLHRQLTKPTGAFRDNGSQSSSRATIFARHR